MKCQAIKLTSTNEILEYYRCCNYNARYTVVTKDDNGYGIIKHMCGIHKNQIVRDAEKYQYDVRVEGE